MSYKVDAEHLATVPDKGIICTQVSTGEEGYRADGPTATVAGESSLDWCVSESCWYMEQPCACFCCFMLTFCAMHPAGTMLSASMCSWCRINGGYKGVDFVGDIACPDIDFATLHVCKAPPCHAFSEEQ